MTVGKKSKPGSGVTEMGCVYLIHFDEPLKHARHYLGYSRNVVQRFESHIKGRGARLLEVLNEQGITYKVVRVWAGVDRHFERKLKRRKGTPKLCPVCRGDE